MLKATDETPGHLVAFPSSALVVQTWVGTGAADVFSAGVVITDGSNDDKSEDFVITGLGIDGSAHISSTFVFSSTGMDCLSPFNVYNFSHSAEEALSVPVHVASR
jgi:hypothetical protein